MAPGELGPCEQTCREPNATETQGNCSGRQAPGCVCQRGHFRSQEGPCVPVDLCECWHHGRPHPVSHCGPQCPLALPDPGLWTTGLSLAPTPVPGPAAAGSLASGWHTWTISGPQGPTSLLKPLLPTLVSGHCPGQAPGWARGGGWVTEKSVMGSGVWRASSAPLPQPGSEWQEACESCRCVSGESICTQHCPPLTCAQVPT